MQKQTNYGNSMYHLTIDWDEPNISFNQSHLHHIPSMNVGYRGTNQTKPNQGFERPSHLNPQLVIPPHSRTSLTITRSVSTKLSMALECLFQPGSRTSNSTHSCPRALENLSNQGSMTSNSTHKGLQSFCPTKASRTSNSNQDVTRLPERLSSQGSKN